ncbi:MAG TPA: TlpA disulfide reductase family protein [Pedobacter sp.]|jgi:peroxiredoxin
MKFLRVLLFFLSILFGNSSFCQAQEHENFSVSGSIVGANGKQIYLFNGRDSLATSRSTFIKDGKFEFKGRFNGDPELYILQMADKAQYLEFLLSNSAIKVEAKADGLKGARITGCVDDSLRRVFNGLLFGKNNRDLEIVSDRLSAADLTTDSTVILKERKRALEQEQNRIVSSFIQSHPKSYASVLALAMFIEYFPVKESEANLALIRAQGKTYKKLGEIEARLNLIKELEVGKVAKYFSQLDTAGREVNLSSFTGKYVLLDFWASWCGPCLKENAYLAKVFQQFKHQNFTIISVSLDKKRDQWLRAIKSGNLSWTQLSDLNGWDNSVAKLYDVNIIPANFLIDPKGKIVAKNLKGVDIEERLRLLYKGSD